MKDYNDHMKEQRKKQIEYLQRLIEQSLDCVNNLIIYYSTLKGDDEE